MLHTLRSFRLLLPLLFALPTLGHAAILRVGTGCTYATPQLAFAAAAHGDTVRIRTGDYLGIDNIYGPFIINHGIRVEGGYDDCSTTARSGRSDLRGNGSAHSSTSLVTVNALPAAQKVVFDRITLRDNYKTSGNGAGLHVTSARVEFNDVEVRNNRALDGFGGGVFLADATLALVEDGTAQITSNSAKGGGGIAADGSSARILFDLGAEGAAAAITDNLTNNVTNGTGSAILLTSGADALFVDTAINLTTSAFFSDSRSALEAGVGSVLSLVRCELIEASINNAYSGIVDATGGQITLRDTVVQGWTNGLVMRDGTVSVEGGRFESNSPTGTTGSYYGGAIRLLGSASLDVRGTVFLANHATYGGAIALMETASASIAGLPAPGAATRFENNVGQYGGAIYSESSGTISINADPVFHGAIEFVGNEATLYGGAIYFDPTASDNTVLHSPLDFSLNHTGQSGGAIYMRDNTLAINARPGEEIAFELNGAVNGDGGAINRQGQGSLQINWGAGSHGVVRFSNNHANNGSSGRGGSIASLGNGSLRLQAPMEFRGGRADYGGQIAVLAATPDVGELVMQGWQDNTRGILVAGGYAEYQGGGIYLAGGGVDATIDWVQVGAAGEPNRFFVGPGANIAVMEYANLVLRNAAIGYADNSPWPPGKGSALYADFGTTVLMESVFGTAGTPPAPGAAWPCEPATLPHNRHCSEILENESASPPFNGGDGGGVYADSGSQVTLRDVSMARNPGDPGAIFVAAGAVVTASDVRMIGHANTIEVAAGGEFTGEHLTLADNTGTALNVADGANVTLYRSIVWNNLVGILLNGAASINSGCNISQAGIHGDNVNPMFVVSNRGSHHLGLGSPALDQCFTDPISNPRDLDGATRQQGSNSDMGAYEGAFSDDSLFASGFE